MIRVGVDVGGTFTDIVLEKAYKRGQQSIFVHAAVEHIQFRDGQ